MNTLNNKPEFNLSRGADNTFVLPLKNNVRYFEGAKDIRNILKMQFQSIFTFKNHQEHIH